MSVSTELISQLFTEPQVFGRGLGADLKSGQPAHSTLDYSLSEFSHLQSQLPEFINGFIGGPLFGAFTHVFYFERF